ncbi:MAG: response regulator transcription factor [Calditrichia bacterium]
MDRKKKVLIIEDDPHICDLVEIHLKDLNYDLDRAGDGESGIQMYEANDYALVILDLMLPVMDGLEVCRRIRSFKRYTPILMLTAKSEEFDRVLGLEMGADDYLTKPFSIRELVARIKAIFRRIEAEQQRSSRQEEDKILQFGELQIDLEKRKVNLAGQVIELTAKEFDLLALFSKNPGRTYTRHELLDRVWGYQFDGYDHTVNSHINRLRGKIETDPAEPRFIKTVWGVGYRFAELEELE